MNIYQSDYTQTPKIFTLIEEHKNEEAKESLKKNLHEIHLKGWMDDTPLHIASQSGNLEMVKYLIQKGADVNAERSGNYTTPLCWADNYEIAKYLLDNGATMNDKELFLATNEDKVEIVDLLLTKGAKIDKDEPQYLKCKSIESISIYINHKIDLNGSDNHNSNLLHKLAWLDLPTVFDFAYSSGCEWKKDDSQRTPYYLAKQGKRENIINHLKEHYSELISNKVENILKEDYVYQRIFFIKQSSLKSDWFIALTKDSNLIRYLKHDDQLITDQIVNIGTPTIRNFTFDENNHIIVPTGDNQLLILEQETFSIINSIKLPNDLVLDQITYLPLKGLYIGSSQNWEIVLLSKDFKIISRTKAEDGTLSPKINQNEDLISFMSYDQETFFNLYNLKNDLSISFIHTFFKEWENTSSGFAFNDNEFVVSFPNDLEYYSFKEGQINKIWKIDISQYTSQHALSYLTFTNENIILIGKGKMILFIDKHEQKILRQVKIDLISEIRSLYLDQEKENLIVYTDSELKLLSLNKIDLEQEKTNDSSIIIKNNKERFLTRIWNKIRCQ